MSSKDSHGVGNLAALEAEAAFDGAKNVGDEHVEAFADRLKHDEVERYSRQRVHHAEHFTAVRLRSTVTIA